MPRAIEKLAACLTKRIISVDIFCDIIGTYRTVNFITLHYSRAWLFNHASNYFSGLLVLQKALMWCNRVGSHTFKKANQSKKVFQMWWLTEGMVCHGMKSEEMLTTQSVSSMSLLGLCGSCACDTVDHDSTQPFLSRHPQSNRRRKSHGRLPWWAVPSSPYRIIIMSILLAITIMSGKMTEYHHST